MLSRSEFDLYARQVAEAERAAREQVSAELSSWLEEYPDATVAQAAAYAHQAVDDAVSIFGDVSGMAAVDMFTVMTGDGTLETVLHREVKAPDHAEEVEKQSRRLEDGDVEGFVSAMASYAGERVSGCANETMALTCARHGIRFARVPTSPKPCAFCSMLASRGYVYHGEPSRPGGINHDSCRCKAMPALGDGLIEGYDTDELFERYLDGVESGEIDLDKVAEPRRSGDRGAKSRRPRRFGSVGDMAAYLRESETIEELQVRCAEVEREFREMGLSDKYRRDLRDAAMARKRELSGTGMLRGSSEKPYAGGSRKIAAGDAMSQTKSAVSIPTSYQGNFDDFLELNISEETRAQFAELRRLSTEDGYEHAQVIRDGEPGQIVTSKLPDKVNIKITEDDGYNLTLLHSHTNETPLSRADFKYLCNEQVDHVGNIAINGDTYVVSVGNGWRPTLEEFEEEVEWIADEVDRDIMEMPEYDSWTIEERNYMAIREQAYRIARHYEWDLMGGL